MSYRLFLKMCIICIIIICSATYGWTAPETTLKFAHIGPAGENQFDMGARVFAEKVNAKTNGEVAVNVFPNAQLGSLMEHWALLKTGDIDFFTLDFSSASIIEPPPKNFEVTYLPFLFDSQEHVHKFVTSDLFEQMMAKVEKANGIKYLGYFGDRFARGLSADRVINTPADIKGLKLRVAPAPQFVSIFKAWGASPTPIGPAELYTSLKSGLVVGVDGDLLVVDAFKLWEVQKYFIALDYCRAGLALWMNAGKWKALSEDHRKAILSAVAETETQVNMFTAEYAKVVEQKMTEGGMTLTRPDPAPWKAVIEKTLLPEKEGKMWEKGLYEKIKALK